MTVKPERAYFGQALSIVVDGTPYNTRIVGVYKGEPGTYKNMILCTIVEEISTLVATLTVPSAVTHTLSYKGTVAMDTVGSVTVSPNTKIILSDLDMAVSISTTCTASWNSLLNATLVVGSCTINIYLSGSMTVAVMQMQDRYYGSNGYVFDPTSLDIFGYIDKTGGYISQFPIILSHQFDNYFVNLPELGQSNVITTPTVDFRALKYNSTVSPGALVDTYTLVDTQSCAEQSCITLPGTYTIESNGGIALPSSGSPYTINFHAFSILMTVRVTGVPSQWIPNGNVECRSGSINGIQTWTVDQVAMLDHSTGGVYIPMGVTYNHATLDSFGTALWSSADAGVKLNGAVSMTLAPKSTLGFTALNNVLATNGDLPLPNTAAYTVNSGSITTPSGVQNQWASGIRLQITNTSGVGIVSANTGTIALSNTGVMVETPSAANHISLLSGGVYQLNDSGILTISSGNNSIGLYSSNANLTELNISNYNIINPIKWCASGVLLANNSGTVTDIASGFSVQYNDGIFIDEKKRH